MSRISPETLQFLRDLKANNNRDWFAENKPIFQTANANIAQFVDVLLAEMRKVDNIENESGKKSLFRIYRDVRFSADKSPYKTHLAAHLKRATQWLRGGYYVHLEPDGLFIGGGFWKPEPKDLKLIRDEIAHHAQPLRDIIGDKGFKNMWGELGGDQVKTAPKGYSKDHPAIDLLRFKGFTFTREFSDEEALSEDFHFEIVKSFIALRPFFDYMSEVLTRHLNE
jgi:uncharacterized protein (TIGR02453 family)